MNSAFMIAGIKFCLNTRSPIGISQIIEEFLCSSDVLSTRTVSCQISVVDDFAPLECRIIHQVPGRMLVMQDITGEREYRVFYHPFTQQPFALYREVSDDEIKLDFLRSVVPEPSLDEGLLETLALERYLIRDNSIILHSASILTDKGAVLFSAPSGTGKSTQAALWQKYRGVKVLNGDRNILHRDENGTWRVLGIPFCGTSGIYTNMDVPLRAIVRLEQAKTDVIYKRSFRQIFSHLYQETTVNGWNDQYVHTAMDLCEALAVETKHPLLACTKCETAVSCLEQYFDEEDKKEGDFVG